MTKARGYLLVETDEGERLCWRFHDFSISDSLPSPVMIYDRPLDITKPLPRVPHHVTLDGQADWAWRPSQRSARLLKAAFQAEDMPE